VEYLTIKNNNLTYKLEYIQHIFFSPVISEPPSLGLGKETQTLESQTLKYTLFQRIPFGSGENILKDAVCLAILKSFFQYSTLVIYSLLSALLSGHISGSALFFYALHTKYILDIYILKCNKLSVM